MWEMLSYFSSGFPASRFDRRDQERQEVVVAAAGRLREGHPLDLGSKLGQRRDDRIRSPHDPGPGRLQVWRDHPGGQLAPRAAELTRRWVGSSLGLLNYKESLFTKANIYKIIVVT